MCRATTADIELAVLTVLSGTPLATAAAHIGMTHAFLADAVALYKAAGHAALVTQAASDGWFQVHIEFANWESAENDVAAHLWPGLRTAQTDGTVSSWWYIRKAPCWRLRFRPGAAGPAVVKQFVISMLEELTRRSLVARWWQSIYEPESCAFGGSVGMATAHQLFHADSTSILEYLAGTAASTSARADIGRRELSILLCSALLRAANQDWHEQGDVWHRVTQMRPFPPGVPGDRLHSLTNQVRRLVSLDTSQSRLRVHVDAPLAFARAWLAAFTHAGHTLGAAAHDGTLHRGVRDILAHHVIFHWNRLGLATRTQGVLARAAFEAMLNPSGGAGTDVATT
ncbi:MAG TPA: thiopeptide-type bacteriocin biosynthesis protein [Mycobacteriales bacterium]